MGEGGNGSKREKEERKKEISRMTNKVGHQLQHCLKWALWLWGHTSSSLKWLQSRWCIHHTLACKPLGRGSETQGDEGTAIESLRTSDGVRPVKEEITSLHWMRWGERWKKRYLCYDLNERRRQPWKVGEKNPKESERKVCLRDRQRTTQCRQESDVREQGLCAMAHGG